MKTADRMQAPSVRQEPPVRRRRRRGGIDWANTYCEVLGQIGQMTKAAHAAGVTLRAVQLRRKADPAFAEREQEAIAVLCDILESEAIRRAVEGVRHERYHRNGQLMCVETRYSDTLLLRLLERFDPTWRRDYRPPIQPETGNFVFATRAERLAALEKARAEEAQSSRAGVQR